jgi:GTP-binding protein EngB required for normal cell division
MSATSVFPQPAHGFESNLAALRQWREATAESLAALRRWAMVNRLIDEHAAARLAHLERRLEGERLTIAFVGEHSRGKSELINAMFFAELGARLLPSAHGRAIQCPTEIAWDPARVPSLRLLPTQTRDSPRALREFLGETETWQEVRLDPSHPESLAGACEALLDSVDAQTPRWRYAVINIPHPLLEGGVAILDTAGYATLACEPELSFHRVPEAAAIVFMLSADLGITVQDRALWTEHVAPIAGIDATCFVALNKIDGLRDGAKTEAQVLVEIDRQVKSTADALGVAPTRIFALSARQGLAAKLQGDRDALIRSRVYRLEQALSRAMAQQRRLDHAMAVRAEARGVLAEMRALIVSRLAYTHEQLEELNALQGKNQKLVETLAKKAGVERGRIEQARAMLSGLRTAHNRNADTLEKLLDPNAARAAGMHAREAVGSSTFSKGIGEALDAFFQQSRETIEHAVGVIQEEKKLMATVGRKFTEEYKIAAVEVAEFGTDRFLVELDRIEEQCAREFKGGSSLVMRSRKSLGTLFFDSVASRVIHVFEIADREARTWLAGFIRPLEAQINAYQEQSNSRIEGMGRIQNAETDLIAKLEELKRLAADVAAQKDQLESHQQRVMSLLEAGREPSLA